MLREYEETEEKDAERRRSRRKQARNRRSEQTSDWLKVRKATQYQRVKDNAEMKKELKSWFDFLDKDGSGEITVEELEDPLSSMGLAKNRAEVESLVNKVDWDGSGNIGFSEFMDIITAKDDETSR